MLAREDRLARGLIPHLRRLAQDHRIHVRLARQHRVERGIVVHPIRPRIPAGDRHQIDAACLFDSGQMLVAGDLAQPDQPRLDDPAHAASLIS